MTEYVHKYVVRAYFDKREVAKQSIHQLENLGFYPDLIELQKADEPGKWKVLFTTKSRAEIESILNKLNPSPIKIEGWDFKSDWGSDFKELKLQS